MQRTTLSAVIVPFASLLVAPSVGENLRAQESQPAVTATTNDDSGLDPRVQAAASQLLTLVNTTPIKAWTVGPSTAPITHPDNSSEALTIYHIGELTVEVIKVTNSLSELTSTRVVASLTDQKKSRVSLKGDEAHIIRMDGPTAIKVTNAINARLGAENNVLLKKFSDLIASLDTVVEASQAQQWKRASEATCRQGAQGRCSYTMESDDLRIEVAKVAGDVGPLTNLPDGHETIVALKHGPLSVEASLNQTTSAELFNKVQDKIHKSMSGSRTMYYSGIP